MYKRILGAIVWVITALGAIHLGLIGLGYDIFALTIFQTTLHGWIIPIHYVIGVAGLLSLYMYFTAMMCKHCTCGCNGKCPSK